MLNIYEEKLKEALENIQDFICEACGMDFSPFDDLNQNYFMTEAEPVQFKHITCMN
jgi:hypothetical protein